MKKIKNQPNFGCGKGKHKFVEWEVKEDPICKVCGICASEEEVGMIVVKKD